VFIKRFILNGGIIVKILRNNNTRINIIDNKNPNRNKNVYLRQEFAAQFIYRMKINSVFTTRVGW